MSYEKLLITGADGFIGSHLSEYMARRGYDVRVFLMYNSFNSWGWLDSSPSEIQKELDLFAVDVRGPNGVCAAMKGCDAVLHLAALIAIPSYDLASLVPDVEQRSEFAEAFDKEYAS